LKEEDGRKMSTREWERGSEESVHDELEKVHTRESREINARLARKGGPHGGFLVHGSREKKRPFPNQKTLVRNTSRVNGGG